MQNYSQRNSSIKKALFIVAFSILVIWTYFFVTTNYVIVRFDELGAITKNMAAYYNGFKIGKIVSIEPDKDFRHTIARINLAYKNINLPQNTTVKVESFPSGELYLNFVYPQSPSLKILKRGDMLEGIAKYSLEGFMLGQNVSGVSDIVSIHVLKALNATEIANQEIQVFFKSTSKLIEENSQEINAAVKSAAATTKSLSLMAENMNQATKKLNNSLDEKALKETTSNIRDTTSFIRTTTESIAIATQDMDKIVKKVDDTISQANETAQNFNHISSGLKITLGQRFAGMRLVFGTPIKKKDSCRNACK